MHTLIPIGEKICIFPLFLSPFNNFFPQSENIWASFLKRKLTFLWRTRVWPPPLADSSAKNAIFLDGSPYIMETRFAWKYAKGSRRTVRLSCLSLFIVQKGPFIQDNGTIYIMYIIYMYIYTCTYIYVHICTFCIAYILKNDDLFVKVQKKISLRNLANYLLKSSLLWPKKF